MKQNIGIVATYIGGFILLNAGVLIYAIINPEIITNTDLLTQVSINANIAFYFISVLVIGIAFRKYILMQLKDFFKRFKKMLIVIVAGVFTIYALALLIGIILTILGVTDQAANQQSINDMITDSNPLQLTLIIIFITMLAPIVEELVFRKGVYGLAGKITMNILNSQDRVTEKKSHLIASIVGIVISSLAFGAIHATDAYIFLYAGLGAVLGLVYFFSNKNIMAAIVVHMLYNTISIVISLLVV